jgi:ABC-type Fe3+/spermidine/putrescine transport system ATPase subunit
VARFVGKSSKFEAVVDPSGQSIRLQHYNYSFPTSGAAGLKPNAHVEIFVKNERFDMKPWTEGQPGISCAIADVVLRGPFFEYILETDRRDRIIAVQPKRDEPLPVASRMLLTWNAAQCHIFLAAR